MTTARVGGVTFEVGQCRRREDGSFEYLRTQSWHSRRGYVETWEPAATHAARNIPLPPAFLRSLREAGLRDDENPTMFELLVLEGWTPPQGYIELTNTVRPAIEAHHERIKAIEAGE